MMDGSVRERDAAEGSDSEGDAQQQRGQHQQQEADDQVGRIIYEPVRLALAFFCPFAALRMQSAHILC